MLWRFLFEIFYFKGFKHFKIGFSFDWIIEIRIEYSSIHFVFVLLDEFDSRIILLIFYSINNDGNECCLNEELDFIVPSVEFILNMQLKETLLAFERNQFARLLL